MMLTLVFHRTVYFMRQHIQSQNCYIILQLQVRNWGLFFYFTTTVFPDKIKTFKCDHNSWRWERCVGGEGSIGRECRWEERGVWEGGVGGRYSDVTVLLLLFYI